MSSVANHKPQPVLHSVEDIPSHPAWSADVDGLEQTIVFSMYSHQMPVQCEPKEWRPHGIGAMTMWWDDEEGSYYRRRGELTRNEVKLPRNYSGLKETLNECLNSKFAAYERTRFLGLAPDDAIPRPVKERLHEEFETFYTFLKASRDDILEIDGMGVARYQHIQDYNNDHPNSYLDRDDPSWAAYTRCTECQEEWVSPCNASEIDMDLVQELTYCPVCLHSGIPEEYVMGPIDFSVQT